jgi:hypothetical protein
MLQLTSLQTIILSNHLYKNNRENNVTTYKPSNLTYGLHSDNHLYKSYIQHE